MPTDVDPAAAAGGILTIDLSALVANWRLLAGRVAPAVCAAVVKADGYGLGLERVGAALHRAGARRFYVALPEEGFRLRRTLPDAEIFVLNGLFPGLEQALLDARLWPVLNDLGQVEQWSRFASSGRKPLPAVIQIDTGMNRLGLPEVELETLLARPELLAPLQVLTVMSHMACADEPDHHLNQAQLAHFRRLAGRLAAPRTSLAASSAIFLGPDFHCGEVRPGIALYGGNPTPGRPNPMAQVIDLKARVLQVRELDRIPTVGYGATFSGVAGSRIATISLGYADGYLRSLSNSGCVFVGDVPVPVAGRVSMDLVTLDVSRLPPGQPRPGDLVTCIGAAQPVDAVASAAGTIGYEILTALGRRFHRVYLG